MTYQRETFASCHEEIRPLLARHWEEIAAHKESIKLDVDWDTYRALDSVGALHVITARLAGSLIGYCIHFLRPHPHYRRDLHAFCDIYYLAPEHRHGRVGLRLFAAVEESLRNCGVAKAMFIVKSAHDHGAIFERMGYTDTEHVYTKLLR